MRVGAYSPSPRIEMEVATKWDRRCLNTSRDADCDSFDRYPVSADAEISALRAELMQAHNRIHELEAESRSAKKKLDHMLRSLSEEKASWKSREHDKVRDIFDGVKESLNRERKNRQRAEIMNSKLATEVSELKLVAKRYLQDYEKERKARELMEEVCDELAKEIA
uniref:RAB6-interacting golgin n=1 Tax=Aegilops tauschii subsp. strangulata TaxID=200361 RepID=A0A452ZG09_AEGTS